VYIDGTVASYRYKPHGLRYQKIVDGVVETHVWNGANMVAEIDANNQVMVKYLRGINLICREDAFQAKNYYLYNAHGDIVQKRDASSGDLWYYDYDTFGNERNVEGQDKDQDINPFRYCGEYFDSETNTLYLRHRYYFPKLGRFMREDPVRDGLNWYTYCGNNPIMHIDPSGMVNMTLAEYIASDEYQALLAANNYQPDSSSSGELANHRIAEMLYGSRGKFNGGYLYDYSETDNGGYHQGADYSHKDSKSQAPIYNIAENAKVVKIKKGVRGKGNTPSALVVKVDDPYHPNKTVYLTYAHLEIDSNIKEGQILGVGDLIGTQDNYGASAKHTHIEMSKHPYAADGNLAIPTASIEGRTLDPTPYFMYFATAREW